MPTRKEIIEKVITEAYYATCFSSDYDRNLEKILEELNKWVKLDSLEEVVHCKDCKYAHMTVDGLCKYCDIWFPDEEVYASGNHFCADGLRK